MTVSSTAALRSVKRTVQNGMSEHLRSACRRRYCSEGSGFRSLRSLGRYLSLPADAQSGVCCKCQSTYLPMLQLLQPYRTSLQGLIALSGSPTAYSAVPGKNLTDVPALAGGNVGLAALVQSRNGARVAVIGSVDLFSDDFCKASVPAAGGCAPSLTSCWLPVAHRARAFEKGHEEASPLGRCHRL